jgi:hypothetical protein
MPTSKGPDSASEGGIGAAGSNLQVKVKPTPPRVTISPTLHIMAPSPYAVVTITPSEADNATAVEGADEPKKKKKHKKHKDGKGKSETGGRRLLGEAWDWSDADAFPDVESVRQRVRVEAIPSLQGGRELSEVDMVPRAEWSDEEMAEVAWIVNQKQKQLVMALVAEADARRRWVMDELEVEFGPTYPWEVEERVEQLERDLQDLRRGGSRRLLMDTFADSLRWVNGLYNDVYGKTSRKVPAHMPHFIDKTIMAELQGIWPERFYNTTSHKFRHPKDMQFAFSYMYYMIHAPVKYDPWEVFQQLDRDSDGILDLKEIELMCLILNADDGAYGRNALDPTYVYNALNDFSFHFHLGNLVDINLSALKDSGKEKFKKVVAWATSSNTTDTTDSTSTAHTARSTINYSIFLRTTELQEKMMKAVGKKKKYKHEEENTNDVDFYMVGNDYDVVKKRLDELRQKGPKFICLNDDMNKTHDPEPKLLGALHDFYTGYFPLPCPFELPEGVVNDFLYLEDSAFGQRRWGYAQDTSYARMAVLMLLVLGMLGLVLPNSMRLRLVLFVKQECCSNYRGARPRLVAV